MATNGAISFGFYAIHSIPTSPRRPPDSGRHLHHIQEAILHHHLHLTQEEEHQMVQERNEKGLLSQAQAHA